MPNTSNSGSLSIFIDRFIFRNHINYRMERIPNDLDQMVSDLIDIYLKASQDKRIEIAGNFNSYHSMTFIVYAERMASYSVRQRSRSDLMRGLLAIVIEGFKYDPRDDWTVLGALYHSAIKIGKDPSELFHEAANYADDLTAKYILDFINRNDLINILDVMYYDEGRDEDGFRYLHRIFKRRGVKNK